jgi:low temperature requirement protein LtrA
MVNKTSAAPVEPDRLGTLVWAYLVTAVATVVALAMLSVTAPHQATREAWGHAVIVAAFAVLLPLRYRSARRGSLTALRAVGVIAAALLLVNVIEALLPHFVPGWMRVEMLGIAVLMALIIVLVVRERI